MQTIGELLTRDLNRRIEEIIQVDQADEESVYIEITEYVATDSIRSQYRQLLQAIADAPTDPHESVGVWVSGFFGSGKSSFAKNLGCALQNRQVLGRSFAELFCEQLSDPGITSLVNLINTRTPVGVILFEVAKEADTRKVTQRIAELMYAVLLRELGYAEDFDIAELEIELEAEGRLGEFTAVCRRELNKDWEKIRAGAQKLSRASLILHKLDPTTYPTPDSWAHAQRNREAAVSVSRVVNRTFELWERRRPGQALVFIIDEVGQHVARSGDKIEDLRATIEEFGKVGRNRVKSRLAKAPCWIVVTSQEKLDEVVAAIDSKRVELAKLQDRFKHRVDLAPADIREVATRRVLAKKDDARTPLKRLFSDHQGQLNASLRLERSTRRTEITEADFVDYYPYPPHYVDLCIGIMSGIRLQPGAPRHYGGSNRTIIKQAYEMLVSDRTAMARQPVGALVTLDKVFELVEGNLSNEKRTDIHQICERFKDVPEDQGWALKVAKVICLMEFLRDLPRTEANLAALLVDHVGHPAPLNQVQAAVKRLANATFIRNTEEGWKLQTAQEKNWTNERSGFLDPRPRERNELQRTALAHIFDEPEYRNCRYQNRSFRISFTIDGTPLGDEGELPTTLIACEDPDEFTRRISEVRTDSQQKSRENELFWLFSVTPEIDELIAQLHASRRMVDKYSQLAAQQKISADEAACLQDEKTARHHFETRLADKLTAAMESGSGLFRGVQRDASALGKSFPEILRKLFSIAMPDLYPKLELASLPLKGDEAEQILKAADLKALPRIFLEGDQGLALVVRDGTRMIVNLHAPVIREVLDFLKAEHSYGNKDSRMGKALERRFGNAPYGWDRDMLRLILATLFRAGEVEVTYQGNRCHSYQDPASRTPFLNNPAFRNALFSPRQSVGLKTLTQAVQILEDLTGEEVDVEESTIATAFKKVASEELERLYPLKATAEAHRLPVEALLSEFQQTLQGVQAANSDDCVRLLCENGPDFGQTRERVRRLREKLDAPAIETLRKARQAVDHTWPRLASHPARENAYAAANALNDLLVSEHLTDEWPAISSHTRTINGTWAQAWTELFDRRRTAYQSAIDEIQNRPEWDALVQAKSGIAESLLTPLHARLGDDSERTAVAAGSTTGRATLTEMESDIAAVDGLKSSVLVRLQELSLSSSVSGRKAPVRKVRVAEFLNRPIQTTEELEQAMELLRDSLQKCIDEGAVIILE